MPDQVIYHGIDLVEVDRVGHAIARWGSRFLQRVFTHREIADCGGRRPSLAARFAAKEAVAKALGTGLRGLGAKPGGNARAAAWREIEVVRLPGGRPALFLHGSAAGLAAGLGWSTISISLTHTRSFAIASVVVLGSTHAPPAPEPGQGPMVQ